MASNLFPGTRTWHAGSRTLAVLIGCSIPLSTSIAELCIGLFIVCWFCSGELQEKWTVVRNNRIAALSLLMFALLAAGTVYSTASWHDAVKCLCKYREFLYVPLLIPIFRDAELRRLGLKAFVAASLAVVAMSYLEVIAGIDIGQLSNMDHVIFKDRIIHSLLMSFLIYLLAHAFVKHPHLRWYCGGAILLTLGDQLFLVQGRTGYIVLCLLTMLFMVQHLGIRGIAYASVLLGLAGSLSYHYLPSIRKRVDVTITQIENQIGPNKRRSDDPRMEFYDNSLQLVMQHPWIGTGTGSFESEYQTLAEAKGLPIIQHLERRAPFDPHNEYLLIAVQLGLSGLSVLLYFLQAQWRCSYRLPAEDRILAQGVWVTIVSGCLFNSLLLGFTGGLLFAYFSAMSFAALSSTDPLAVAGPRPDQAEPARRSMMAHGPANARPNAA